MAIRGRVHVLVPPGTSAELYPTDSNEQRTPKTLGMAIPRRGHFCETDSAVAARQFFDPCLSALDRPKPPCHAGQRRFGEASCSAFNRQKVRQCIPLGLPPSGFKMPTSQPSPSQPPPDGVGAGCLSSIARVSPPRVGKLMACRQAKTTSPTRITACRPHCCGGQRNHARRSPRLQPVHFR